MPSAVPSSPLDPAMLASFRREAAAIIAQERGLTPGCRIRLAQAASTSGIPADRVEEAIRWLSIAEPAAPPSAAAERFRQRLRKDLSAKSRPIIGPTMEAKILSAAQRKFGLSDDLASQILGEVAAELGLTRITATDAIDSLAAQIDQAAGASTWLARETWDRLRSAGTKWGLELEVIDAMIDERLAANRTDRRRRQRWTKATLYGAGGAVLAVGIVLIGLAIARSQRAELSLRAMPSPAGQESPLPPLPTTPAWWDVTLSVDMAGARGRGSAPPGVLTAIGSPRAEERALAYEQLLAHAAETTQADRLTDLQRVIAGCLALETDPPAAARLRTALAALLPTAATPVPADEDPLARSLWAAQTFGLALDRAGVSEERKEALASVVADALGGTFLAAASKEDRQRLLRQRTMLAWYAHLSAAAAKEPAQVAKIFPALAQRAEAVLSEEDKLAAEATFLQAALPAAGEHWEAYKRTIGRLISSPDPLLPLRLVEALRRAAEPALVEYLSQLLIARSGAEPRSASRKDVAWAVRKALSGDRGGFTLADRWLTLGEEAADALSAKRPVSREQVLRETVRLAHLTTLAIALAQGEGGLASFDARIEQPPVLETPRQASIEPAARPRAAAGLSKDQQRELAACLDDLGKTGAVARPAREAAWRRLANLAQDVADIPPAAAAQIAAQALAPQDAGEFSRRMPIFVQLRSWKHFRLAVADKLAASRLSADQHRALVAALTGAEPDDSASAVDLRRALFMSVVQQLTSADEAAASGELLDAAQARLGETYFERARLLGASPAEIEANDGPRALAAACLAKVAADPAQVQRQMVAARFVTAANDIRYLAGIQSLLIEASADRLAARRPDRALAARRIAAEYEKSAAGAADALAQLVLQERALLELWMLYAPDA